MPEIVELLVSSVHRWAGRPADGVPDAPVELVRRVSVRAGLGLVGDRYFNAPAHRDASVTLVAAESLAPWSAGLAQVRRNVLLRGVDVDSALGRVLVLDSGSGPVRLAVRRAAHPCAWLDVTVAAGAWKALRGRGGVRCVPLDDGELHVGPVSATWLDSPG